MNPQYLKLLSDWSDLYRHLITLAFAQHGPAQRGFAADDLNELSAADQLHAAAIRAEKEVLLLVVGIDQADQRAELYTFSDVVGTRAELAPSGQRQKNRPRAAPQLTSPIRPVCWVLVGVHQNWATATRIHGITSRTLDRRTALSTPRCSTPTCVT